MKDAKSERIRMLCLGRKGILPAMMKLLKHLPQEQRQEMASALLEFKKNLTEVLRKESTSNLTNPKGKL